ncbi:hypothetical protein A6M27_01400 [Acidithiobacillus thiooxidans]|uniref:Uncharacterized protein n=1 Tax=Acidithiobacillus thiooxidans TaxID=930 RepID=A0A1C2IZ49_ACITH|nr:restriction endonuclease [Acidithiobacillus thiooxidans]OCX76529.1 hypothetical protein A6O24_08575 [Acidithiobacillus thiooxidans]OCX76713.1 hypothetical protein A6P07_01955 [Acidithiobacillus thiooxidans]OCX81177.1 hypothetical protein A6O26_13525 [Acidithiobacillus thiooxidans]OCX89550.1 hypothetical protein A6M27_01400 [Acidithiobacillus thiooxidans]
MLTPMMVQYLVGLCCLRHDPEAVDITVGDMVSDEAAGKERDVDVTVTINDSNGELSEFKAFEVKNEGKPLDVVTVEQIILKLTDMPKVTHKAIFSTSGYTKGAQAKAKKHGVDLYSILPWNRPIAENFPDFPKVGTPGEFLTYFQSNLLYWAEWQIQFIATTGPESFSYKDETPLFSAEGKKHQQYPAMREYLDKVLMRSTGILCTQNPARTVLNTFPFNMNNEDDGYLVGPAWPHTHTIDLSNDEAYLKLEGRPPFRLDFVTISGQLQWRKRIIKPHFYIFERSGGKEIFAGAAIADYGVDDGRMFAMTFPDKGREVGIHQFQIPEKQRNLIRGLKIQTEP